MVGLGWAEIAIIAAVGFVGLMVVVGVIAGVVVAASSGRSRHEGKR